MLPPSQSCSLGKVYSAAVSLASHILQQGSLLLYVCKILHINEGIYNAYGFLSSKREHPRKIVCFISTSRKRKMTWYVLLICRTDHLQSWKENFTFVEYSEC